MPAFLLETSEQKGICLIPWPRTADGLMWGSGRGEIASYINNNFDAGTKLKPGRNVSKETSVLVNVRRNVLYIES